MTFKFWIGSIYVTLDIDLHEGEYPIKPHWEWVKKAWLGKNAPTTHPATQEELDDWKDIPF